MAIRTINNGSHLSCGTATTASPAAPMSMLAWVYWTNEGAYALGNFVRDGNDYGAAFILVNNANGGFYATIANNSAQSYVYNTTQLPTNTWSLIGMTVGTGSVYPQPWYNGVAQNGSSGGPGSGMGMHPTYKKFSIGSLWLSGSFNAGYTGQVGEVRIYDRILTSTEWLNIYNAKGGDSIMKGCVGRWLNLATDGATPGTINDLCGTSPLAVNGSPVGKQAPFKTRRG